MSCVREGGWDALAYQISCLKVWWVNVCAISFIIGSGSAFTAFCAWIISHDIDTGTIDVECG